MNEEPGLVSPNYTQSPNHFYDEILPQIDSLAELKVTDVIIRQTFGFHRDEKELSISLLMTLTGLVKQPVIDGVGRALARGTIERRPFGQGFLYRLRLVQKVDQSKTASLDSRPPLSKSLTSTGLESRPEPVQNLDTWKEKKETLKESSKESKFTPSAAVGKSLAVPKQIKRQTEEELVENLELARGVEQEQGTPIFQILDELDASNGGWMHAADVDILRMRVTA